jgi:long-chain acyl-CoA synthetase
MESLAAKNGWPKDHGKMVKDGRVAEHIESRMKSHLEGKFGGYEIPKKIIILAEPFSTENGILTPTLKLKRRKVLELYGDEIESLYD